MQAFNLNDMTQIITIYLIFNVIIAICIIYIILSIVFRFLLNFVIPCRAFSFPLLRSLCKLLFFFFLSSF